MQKIRITKKTALILRCWSSKTIGRHISFLLCCFLCIQCNRTEEKTDMGTAQTAQQDTSEYLQNDVNDFDQPSYEGAIDTSIFLKPYKTGYTEDLVAFIDLSKRMNLKIKGTITRSDSIEFYCDHNNARRYGKTGGKLTVKGVTTFDVHLVEKTKDRMRVYLGCTESIFRTEKEATSTVQIIRDFVYGDSALIAYCKRPVEIYQYKNRIYQISTGNYMGIPAMKKASQAFRQKLGSSVKDIFIPEWY
jgi:hypothetical protein